MKYLEQDFWFSMCFWKKIVLKNLTFTNVIKKLHTITSFFLHKILAIFATKD